jgi:hypothetical protein
MHVHIEIPPCIKYGNTKTNNQANEKSYSYFKIIIPQSFFKVEERGRFCMKADVTIWLVNGVE